MLTFHRSFTGIQWVLHAERYSGVLLLVANISFNGPGY